MKASVMLLFGASLFLGFYWNRQVKRNQFLIHEIEVRDSVNKANKVVIERLRGDSIEYSERFNLMVETFKKKYK